MAYNSSGTHSEIEVIGRLTDDPSMRFTPTGKAVTSFGLAENRKRVEKVQGGDDKVFDTPVYYQISVWNGMAEVINQYLATGRKVFVKGQLDADRNTGRPRLWTKKDTGEVCASFEVTAFKVIFLDGPREGESVEAS